MGVWNWLFADQGSKINQMHNDIADLQNDVSKLKKEGKKQMTAITDLTTVVDEIADTAAKHADEVKVAIDELKAAVAAAGAAKGDDPAVVAAVEKLQGIHTVISDTAAELKAAVDSVSASGGKATP